MTPFPMRVAERCQSYAWLPFFVVFVIFVMNSFARLVLTV